MTDLNLTAPRNEPNPMTGEFGVAWDTHTIHLDPRAHAMRPVRVLPKENRFRYYTATWFPNAPYNGIHQMLRMVLVTGGFARPSDKTSSEDHTDLILDILNEEGDIIQDFELTRDGFEFLRRKLKFVVDKNEEE